MIRAGDIIYTYAYVAISVHRGASFSTRYELIGESLIEMGRLYSISKANRYICVLEIHVYIHTERYN